MVFLCAARKQFQKQGWIYLRGMQPCVEGGPVLKAVTDLVSCGCSLEKHDTIPQVASTWPEPLGNPALVSV